MIHSSLSVALSVADQEVSCPGDGWVLAGLQSASLFPDFRIDVGNILEELGNGVAKARQKRRC